MKLLFIFYENSIFAKIVWAYERDTVKKGTIFLKPNKQQNYESISH